VLWRTNLASVGNSWGCEERSFKRLNLLRERGFKEGFGFLGWDFLGWGVAFSLLVMLRLGYYVMYGKG
jgi:hypothetical protein